MEDADLLDPTSREAARIGGTVTKTVSNGSALRINDETTARGPPDGGARAWSIMVGSFLTNGILFGVINSYSVVYNVLLEQLQAQEITEAASKASLVGALTIGTTFFLSPVSAALTNALGIRRTAMLGGSIAAGGMLASSFVVHNVNALYFTYGVMYGMGAALAYTPSLAILGHYFHRYLGLVNGIVTAGSSVFTIIMPLLLKHLIGNYGLPWTLRVVAIITIGVALCGVLFKPTPQTMFEKPKLEKRNFKAGIKTIVDVEIFKNKKYLIWVLAIPCALFGYFVPYVHLTKFVEYKFPGNGSILAIQCMGATSGVGRLIFGYLADRPKIDRILLQQISFYVIGILTIILPFVNSFSLLIVIALGMGIFDGAFISLLGPIAFDLCGHKNAAQAIGCLLGFASLPLSVGPPIAGFIYEATGSYRLPFILAGIPPLLGSSFMFAIRLVKPPPVELGKLTANGSPSKYGDNNDASRIPLHAHTT